MQTVTKKLSKIFNLGAPTEFWKDCFTHPINVISCSLDVHTLTPVLVKK